MSANPPAFNSYSPIRKGVVYNQMSYFLFCSALLIVPATIIVTGLSPEDTYSVIGALCASVIVLMFVRKQDASLSYGVAAFLGSIIGGVTIPGTMMLWLQNSGSINTTNPIHTSWHLWMLLGFMCGLGGWAGAQALYFWFVSAMPKLIMWLTNKFLK